MERTAHDAALRIVDANRNRAIEGLRVVEDYARFARDDRALFARLKDLRHQLHHAVEDAAPLPVRLRARAVDHDPGHPAAAEPVPSKPRHALHETVRANFARAQEATRALEEYLRVLAPPSADRVSAVRYALYDLERTLLLHRPPLHDLRVYAILGEAASRPPLLDQALQLAQGGIRLLQVRLKNLPDGPSLERIQQLREALQPLDAHLIVNDRPDLAALAGASGVHVGVDDLPPAAARQVVGDHTWVGASCHDPQELTQALVSDTLDYVGFGTLFASPTKPDLTAQGLQTLAALAPTCPVPIYGIGGVTADNAAQVLDAGAHGVVVSSALLDAPDLTAAAARLVDIVDRAVSS